MLKASNRYTFCANLESTTNSDANQNLQTTSLHHQKQFNAMLLTIPTGHTIKEHVSPQILTLQIISGMGSVTVGNETHTVSRGAWFYIAPNIPHEIVSNETLTVLLSMYTLPEAANGVLANE
ncbi:MAG: cupin domain-containing protein [Anaerolineae bacterium]|nr:cupin domain-containing protein [Anaerolineae bacterium]